MIPYLFHICGPIYANCYGLAILIAILILIWLLKRDRSISKIATPDQIINTIIFGTILGVLGGAIFWGITSWDEMSSWIEMFTIWRGGFSILGTIITIGIFIPFYLKYNKIPVIKFLDRLVIYAPLVQSISRIGCLCSGCCYGLETDSCLGITYTHPDSSAPLDVKMHPTQIYSSIMLLFTFIFLYFLGQRIFKKDGQLISIYLILASLERFILDFWRADRTYFAFQENKILSSNQILAVIIFLVGFALFIYYSFYRTSYIKRSHPSTSSGRTER